MCVCVVFVKHMWLTLTLLLAVFYLWGLTSLVLALVARALCVSSIGDVIVALLSRIPLLPANFVSLMSYAPNVGLVFLYYSFRLPRCDWIRYAGCWQWLRTHWITAADGVPPRRPSVSGPCIYAVFPHGAYGEVVALWYMTNPDFVGVEVLVTSLVFWIPIVREVVCLFGAIPVTRGNIMALLDAGKSLVIVPEGTRGTLHLTTAAPPLSVFRGIPGESAPRMGFIQCACASKNANSTVIVPMVHRGAEKTYLYFQSWPWLQRRMQNTYGYPWPLVNIGWMGSFLPRPASVSFFTGVPIPVVAAAGDAGSNETRHLRIFEEVARQAAAAFK